MLARDLSLALDPALLMQELGLSPDPWQLNFLRSQAQRQILLCTRQAGKSTTTAVLALHEALYRAGALVLLLSPSLRQSQELFRKVLATYKCIETIPSTMESTLYPRRNQPGVRWSGSVCLAGLRLLLHAPGTAGKLGR